MRRENCITVCIGPDCEGCRNYKTEVMKTAEDYIKEKWGDEWLNHDWQGGDVIGALTEYASEVTADLQKRNELLEQLVKAQKELSEYASYFQPFHKIKPLKKQIADLTNQLKEK